MNIFLIGYRCTGKTSVGKFLATTLGWSFVDADSRLVEKYGMTIKEIVDKQGWEAFRKKERVEEYDNSNDRAYRTTPLQYTRSLCKKEYTKKCDNDGCETQ